MTVLGTFQTGHHLIVDVMASTDSPLTVKRAQGHLAVTSMIIAFYFTAAQCAVEQRRCWNMSP
jgi:hypothetical protein